jgi:hypothetical protein
MPDKEFLGSPAVRLCVTTLRRRCLDDHGGSAHTGGAW